jgi:hypothetical protein
MPEPHWSGKTSTKDYVDDVLTQVAHVEWHDAQFQPGWSNVGDPWSPVRYRRTLNNVVHVEGKATHPADFDPQATWLPIFQLPPDCLPYGAIEYGCLSNDNAISKIVVWGDGMIIWAGYATGQFATNIPYVALAAINFSVGTDTPAS